MSAPSARPATSPPPSGRTDPAAHKRYLEYRDKHGYFGKMTPQLSMADFEALEAEFVVLDRLECLSHDRPVPAGGAALTPVIIILRLTVHPDHAVDR